MSDSRRVPPHDNGAEMSVLGAALLDADALATAHDIITASDFYRTGHSQIFTAMTALSDRGEPVDLVTLEGELRKRGELESAGGAAYLVVLFDAVPMAANAAYYCRTVAAKAAARRLITNATEGLCHAYDGDTDAAVAKLETAIQPASEREQSGPVGMVQCSRELLDRLEQRKTMKGRVTGLPYGLSDLDTATLGMHPGQLIIIAGRPSMGKTALALNVVRNVCRTGKRALCFTLEMDRGECTERFAAGANIRYQNIRSGNLEEIEYVRMAKAVERMREWGLEIDDTPAVSLRHVRSKAKRACRKGLDLVVIDYLQLMSLSDPKASRVQGLGEISRGLKQLARELKIPVILLSQLNRSVDSRNDKRPMMSDLRDSGEIEQDADVILFPFRPAAYCQECRDRVDSSSHNWKAHQSQAEIIIEKQRAGERNVSVSVVWQGEYQRFESMKRGEDLP